MDGSGAGDVMTDDIEQIKQLKARYFRLMDTKDWKSLDDVFAEDVVIDVRSDGHPTSSRVSRLTSPSCGQPSSR